MADKKNKNLKHDWHIVRLGDLVENVNDFFNSDSGDIVRYVAGEHIDEGDLQVRRFGLTSDELVPPTFNRLFKAGDVLFHSRNIEKLAQPHFDGLTGEKLFVLRVRDQALMLQDFLPYLLQSDHFRNYIQARWAGSTNKFLNKTPLMAYKFALPPLDEQITIIELLEQFDDQIECYSDALIASNKLRASIGYSEFVESGVPAVPLGQLCEKTGIQIGPFGAQLHSYDYVTDGIPVVMPADMTKGKVVLDRIARVSEIKATELQQHRIRQGDILLPRRGELDRRAWVSETEEGWLCGTGSIRIRVAKGINPRGVFYALSLPTTVSWLKANAVGTTMPNLNSKIVASIPIMLPSSERLTEVVTALDRLDSSERDLMTRRQTASDLRSRMLNRLFGDRDDV